jgi:hypothetical protein
MTGTKRSIPEASIDTQYLYERLKKVGVGEMIGYDELSELVQRDVRNGAHGNLSTARNRLMRDDQMVFEAVRGKGLKRLTDAEIVSTGQSVLDRTRRAARRGFIRNTCVDYDRLADADKVKHNAYASIFNVVQAVSKGSAVRKIEGAMSDSKQVLPLAATLEAFKK